MYNNLRYLIPLHFILLITNLLPDNVFFLRLRGFLVKPFFGSCGADFRIGRNITFYNSKNIHIGSNVYIAMGNWFNASESIFIGDEVMFAPKSVIVSSNHTFNNNSYRYGKPKASPIKIGTGTWVAANCTITAGSKIGKGCLISANSCVISDIPDYSVYGGVPAKLIKKIK